MDALRKTLLAEGGRDGFDSYRVPGLAVTAAGTLLACCEGRIKEGDRRTLLLYRSTDDGATFAPRTVLAEPAPGQLLHNPMLLACRDGRVLLFWCSDYGHLYLRVSRDDGCTFGETRNLTGAIDGFRKEWPVTLWAIAPGHGVEMKNGTLVVPLWLSRGENAHLPACYACLYSTDGGETWLCSNVVPAANGIGDPTEASVAERSDGTLLATLRHEIPGVRRRAFCAGGPVHWGQPWLNEALPDPICGGALLTLADGRLTFVNCACGDEEALERQRRGEAVRWSLNARRDLTLRVSGDDGNTWSAGVLLEKEAGAADLAQSPKDGAVLCLHEQGWEGGNCIFTHALTLTRVPLALLR